LADYFKKDALPFAWTLLTDVVEDAGRSARRVVFKGENGIPRDDEATTSGAASASPLIRILELGGDDNFWQMGDTGTVRPLLGDLFRPRRHRCRSRDRDLEQRLHGIRAQRRRHAHAAAARRSTRAWGSSASRRSSRTRIRNYDTDVFMPILTAIAAVGAHIRRHDEPSDVSMRVVADHIRATTFLIADGVIPSNEWRGYVLRKIMRRAMRHASTWVSPRRSCTSLVRVLDANGRRVPRGPPRAAMIEKTILAEENRFEAVLTEGLPAWKRRSPR